MEFLKKRSEFLALRKGERAPTPSFLMVRRRRDDGAPTVRAGLTVTKKIGGAVARNRIRRRLRAAVKEVFPQYAAPGSDYLVIARAAAGARRWRDLLDDMKRALLRLSHNST